MSHYTTPPAQDPQSLERARAFALLCKDLPTFARHCLRIRDKSGTIVPLVFNKAQMYAHQQFEAQKRRLGFVRAVVLKGRQQGMSTYVAARYFHQTLLNRGTTTFILSHEAKSTGALFDMTKRYYDNLPAGMAPGLDTANKNQLKFTGTDSEYTVGTAGSEDVGRSMTLKHLHMSEVAFYAKTDELETGLMNAVADMPGTEIVQESTANGMGNMFHESAMKAQAGLGLYQLVFIPWYWQEEYRLTPPEGFAPDEKEAELMAVYKLDLQQIYWRRMKVQSTKGGLWTFQQEYPCTPDEAFLMSGERFFKKEDVIVARQTKPSHHQAPVVMGIDCGRENDRSAFVLRRGRDIFHYEVHKDLRANGQKPTQELISIAARLIDKYNVTAAFIDIAYGAGLVDGLQTLKYKEIIGVNFGQEPMNKVRALNKRAEMYLLLRDWFEEGGVSIPDDDIFAFDLLIIPKEKETPTHRAFLPKKSEIRTQFKISPDITDAAVLTFAFPVKMPRSDEDGEPRTRNRVVKTVDHKSELSTLNRIRGASKRESASVKVNF